MLDILIIKFVLKQILLVNSKLIGEKYWDLCIWRY